MNYYNIGGVALLTLLAYAYAGSRITRAAGTSKNIAEVPTGKDPYRTPPTPKETKAPKPQKEKKMSQPLTKKQSIGVQSVLLGLCCAVALIAYGVFFPIMNDGLKVTSALAIACVALGGMVGITWYND